MHIVVVYCGNVMATQKTESTHKVQNNSKLVNDSTKAIECKHKLLGNSMLNIPSVYLGHV